MSYTPGVEIRLASMSDLVGLTSMLAEYLKEESAAGGHVKLGTRSMEAIISQWIKIMRSKVPGAVFIARDGEAAVGFTSFYVEVPQIDHLYSKVAMSFINYVLPSHRRLGIASDLITAKESLARSMGCKAIITYVREANSASIALVTNMGYRPHTVTLTKEL